MIFSDNTNIYMYFPTVTLIFKNFLDLSDFGTNCFTNKSSTIWFFKFIEQQFIMCILMKLNTIIDQ